MTRFVIILMLLITVTVCFAGTTGKLAGKVKDENGKGLGYVNVLVFQNGVRVTGILTKENGTYIIINLLPGKYEVRFQSIGYAQYIVTDVVIKIDQTTTVNANLQKESVNLKTITVTANQNAMKKDPTGTEGNMAVTDIQDIVALNAGTSIAGGQSQIKGGKSIDLSQNGAQIAEDELRIKDFKNCRYIHNYMPPPPPDFITEDYATVVENNYKYAIAEPLSTFSIDVDTACYSNIRRFLDYNQLPEKGYVRIEELLNYFDYNYPQPKGEEPFAVYTELGTCPWNSKHELLHIGLQGKDMNFSKAPKSNLVFLLDVSGSMDSPNKLPLVIQSMKLLVNQLRPEDKVAIVVYAGASGLVLPSTSGEYKEAIISALENLRAGGSTAGGAGIILAYKTAKANFIKDGNNRVILCTDGDFNTGASSDAAMEALITEKREEGIFLTVLGYGMGNYKDNKMEILADKGNGNYAYIDNLLEAQKVLVRQMGGTLFTIAKDVKLQLEFNPAKVKAYRLIGYENRKLNNEDFNDDKKDAGELGAGHTVTALYEIIPAGSDETINGVDPLKYQSVTLTDEANKYDELLTLKLRYKKPDSDTSKLIVKIVEDKPVKEASQNFRFASAVAGFGLMLKDSQYKANCNWNMVIDTARGAIGKDANGYRKEFVTLSEKARDLTYKIHKPDIDERD